MDKNNIVIVGAGRGMGNHIAEEFGRNGFRVVLMARNQASLDAYAREFADRDIEAYGVAADAGDTASLSKAFAEVQRRFGAIDVLVYNACILQGGRPSESTADELTRHYQVDVAGALHSVLQVLPGMRAKKRGTVLFTGGGLALNPLPEFACISIDKAALRALAFTLHRDLAEDGIFTGTVTITGNVAPHTAYDPAEIAKAYWRLYRERAEAEIVF